MSIYDALGLLINILKAVVVVLIVYILIRWVWESRQK